MTGAMASKAAANVGSVSTHVWNQWRRSSRVDSTIPELSDRSYRPLRIVRVSAALLCLVHRDFWSPVIVGAQFQWAMVRPIIAPGPRSVVWLMMAIP